MNIYTFAIALGWQEDEVLPRMRVLKLNEPCSRCDGKGHVGFEKRDDTKCFKCKGAGDQLPKLTRDLASNVAARLIRGELNPYYKQRRRESYAVKNRVIIGHCQQIWEALAVLKSTSPRLAEAQELYWGAGDRSGALPSVVDLEDLIGKSDIEPEAAHAALTTIHRLLTEIWISCQDVRSA